MRAALTEKALAAMGLPNNPSDTIVNDLLNVCQTGAEASAKLADYIDPAGNDGWVVIGNEVGNRVAKRFDSRENVVGVPPVLCVAASPPPVIAIPTLGPVALVLLALALGVVALRRLTAA